MAFYGLRLKYSLEGSSKYVSWRDWMEAVLEENGLKDFIDMEISKETQNDAQDLVEWNKCVEKAKMILLEGVRDHIVSNLHGNETPHVMWKALTYFFQNSSNHMNLDLKDKLRKIKMEGGKTIPKYLAKFTQCQDELGSVGVTVAHDDLVRLKLLGLPKSWHSYRDSEIGRAHV